MAPEGGTNTQTHSSEEQSIRRTLRPSNSYLNTTLAELMASGFQRALSKAQPGPNGELVLTLDAAFTRKRVIDQSSGTSH